MYIPGDRDWSGTVVVELVKLMGCDFINLPFISKIERVNFWSGVFVRCSMVMKSFTRVGYILIWVSS